MVQFLNKGRIFKGGRDGGASFARHEPHDYGNLGEFSGDDEVVWGLGEEHIACGVIGGKVGFVGWTRQSHGGFVVTLKFCKKNKYAPLLQIFQDMINESFCNWQVCFAEEAIHAGLYDIVIHKLRSP